MNRLAVIELLPLAVAAAILLWWLRNLRRDESGAYWRAVPLLRLKYLIAAQCLIGASVAFLFDLLRGGTGDRAQVLLLAVLAASVLTALFLLRMRGTPRVARGATVGVALLALILFRVSVPAISSSSNGPLQFGVDRVTAQIAAVSSKPLKEILEAVIAEAAAHGASDDDRSLLVIRVL